VKRNERKSCRFWGRKENSKRKIKERVRNRKEKAKEEKLIKLGFLFLFYFVVF
jgi:hypothetical protein